MGWSIHHPVGLIHYTPTARYRGYTLFSTTHGGKDAYWKCCQVWQDIGLGIGDDDKLNVFYT